MEKHYISSILQANSLRKLMTIIIDGKSLANQKLDILKAEVSKLTIKPCIAIILVGDNPASKIYVENKAKAASSIGIEARIIRMTADIAEANLLEKITECNNDKSVSGIIVQLPLPDHIQNNTIISSIAPKKDVDGFHPTNVGMLYSGQDPFFIPCTPLGILELIQSQFASLEGLHAAIIGRSNIVGKPLASLLLKHNLTVTICHSKTKDLASITKEADIVITASGQTLSFGREYFSEKSVIIDVGINRTPEGKIAGDVKFDDVFSHVKAITKVPGGVGPMTIANLLSNTLKAFCFK